MIDRKMIWKTLHRKRKIHHESHQKTGVKSCDSERLAVSAPLVTPVVLLLNDTTTTAQTYKVSKCSDNTKSTKQKQLETWPYRHHIFQNRFVLYRKSSNKNIASNKFFVFTGRFQSTSTNHGLKHYDSKASCSEIITISL